MGIFDLATTIEALSKLDRLDWLLWIVVGGLLNPIAWFLFEIVKDALKGNMAPGDEEEDLDFASGFIAFIVVPLILFHLSVVLGVNGGPTCQTVWESGGGAQEVCE